ncbi:MAG: tetratricopeptide repeat protein [Brevinematia bacterium]
MNVENLFSFLGRENTVTPERILKTIEEAKISQTPKESSQTSYTVKPEFVESNYGKIESDVFKEEISEPNLGLEPSVDEKIDELLSIFDGPIPTYEDIKKLTIPEIVKESTKSTSFEEPVIETSFQEEKLTPVTPEEASAQFDVAELLKDFKVGEAIEEKEEVSKEELETLLGVSETVEQSLEKEIKEEIPTEFGPESFLFTEPSKTEEEIIIPEEGEELFGFGETTKVQEKVDEIIKGIEQAEEVQIEQPIEEFQEDFLTGGYTYPEETKEEKIPEKTFEEVSEVFPEEKYYQPTEKEQKYYEEVSKIREPTKREEISEEDAARAISLLKNYPSDIKKAVKDLIGKGIISESDINSLLKRILSSPSSEELRNYIKEIAPFYRFEEGRRIIVAAKKSKLEEALEKTLKRSIIAFVGVGVIAFIGFIIFSIVSRNIYSENLYNKGLNLIDTGYYEEAENLFKRAEEVGGRKKEWYQKYAIRYIYNNVPDRAVKKIEDALKIWPYDYNLSLVYIDALTKLPEPNFNKALEYSEAFRRKENNSFRGIDLNAQVYAKMGDYYNSKNYYKDAETLYMKYLKAKDNKHIPSLFRLISIYIKLDEKEKVYELYEYIKKIDEKAVSEVVGVEMARYFIDKNDLPMAKKVLFELSTIKPKNPDFYYEFARYLFANENYREAVKNLKIALSLNPKHSKSYILMGDIDYILKNKQSAIDNYKKSIEIDPSQGIPYLRLGDIFYEDKEYITALGYYLEGLKSVKLEDNIYSSKIHYNIAKIYYINGMLNESLRYLSYSYVLDPQNPILSHFIANIYLEQGKPDIALVQYNKSIEGYQRIIQKIKVIDSKITRHREIVSLLIRSYNNQGIAYISLKGQESLKNAMLSWWEAKNYAEKINAVYPEAEYNLKLVLHPNMTKYRNFAMDKEIPDTIPKYIYNYTQN